MEFPVWLTADRFELGQTYGFYRLAGAPPTDPAALLERQVFWINPAAGAGDLRAIFDGAITFLRATDSLDGEAALGYPAVVLTAPRAMELLGRVMPQRELAVSKIVYGPVDIEETKDRVKALLHSRFGQRATRRMFETISPDPPAALDEPFETAVNDYVDNEWSMNQGDVNVSAGSIIAAPVPPASRPSAWLPPAPAVSTWRMSALAMRGESGYVDPRIAFERWEVLPNAVWEPDEKWEASIPGCGGGTDFNSNLHSFTAQTIDMPRLRLRAFVEAGDGGPPFEVSIRTPVSFALRRSDGDRKVLLSHLPDEIASNRFIVHGGMIRGEYRVLSPPAHPIFPTQPAGIWFDVDVDVADETWVPDPSDLENLSLNTQLPGTWYPPGGDPEIAIELQRGDQDAGAGGTYYGGTSRAAGPNNRIIRDLIRLLRNLGFNMFGAEPTGAESFGPRLECAIRELQICAQYSVLARETGGADLHYPARLVPFGNSFLGETRWPAVPQVNGKLDDITAQFLRWFYLNDCRCPIVVQVRDDDAPHDPAEDADRSRYSKLNNLWWWNDHPSAVGRMHVRDLSEYYDPPDPVGAFDFRVMDGTHKYDAIGYYVADGGFQGPTSGTGANPITWYQPGAMVGAHLEYGNLALDVPAGSEADALATYRVIEPTALEESKGGLDIINAYDNKYFSIPLFHYVFGELPPPPNAAEAEMAGVIQYAFRTELAVHNAALANLGLKSLVDFPMNFARGTWNGKLAQQRTDSVSHSPQTPTWREVRATADDFNYFRNWHWVHRFVMLGRSQGFNRWRRVLWDMARLRVRSILRTPWSNAGQIANVPLAGGGTRPAQIGDVFRSARAAAMLLRWHVYRPGQIVNGAVSSGDLAQVVSNAVGAAPGATWGAQPYNTDAWALANEDALAEQLKVLALLRHPPPDPVNNPNGGMGKAVERIFNIAAATLPRTRDPRFVLYETGLAL